MEAINVYVPASGHRPWDVMEAGRFLGIDPGSGIVGTEQALTAGVERVLVHYEGARYGQANMVTFADRVYHAWGRMSEDYPTSAKAWLPSDMLTQVGLFYPERGVVELLDGRGELAAWLGLEEIHPTELLCSHVRQELVSKVHRDIERVGWSVIGVFPTEGDEPKASYSYTIGLLETEQHPELIVFGLPPEQAHGILSCAVDLIREGTRLEAGRRYGRVLRGFDVEMPCGSADALTGGFGPGTRSPGRAIPAGRTRRTRVPDVTTGDRMWQDDCRGAGAGG